MGRYRPPTPPKAAYITKEGYQVLLAEEKALWKKRRTVVQALSAAAAEGEEVDINLPAGTQSFYIAKISYSGENI